jgi:hypothetical protein
MEAWFDPQTAGKLGGIIGTVIGLMGALGGCSCGICVRKGWKKPIYTIFISSIAIGIGLLITGLVALCVKQPYHVWYAFLLPGFLTTIILSIMLPFIRNRFIQHEMMKMQAEDL